MNEDYIFEEEDEVNAPHDSASSDIPVGPPEPKKGMAIAAMVLGIISLELFLLAFNILTGITAIILSVIYLVVYKGKSGKIMAWVGMVTGLLSIVLFIISYSLIASNVDNLIPALSEYYQMQGYDADAYNELDVQDTL
ncbi:MAG: DUF4190 domain-containing protein [Pseudobutyrivibrio sp.]|nr:DUF4190 domain-containing protein [Pseudobutyrivibrio sp.]